MLTHKHRAGQPHPAPISTRQNRPWTDPEVATMARGFIDLDLDGNDLHRWCRQQGIDRTPGAIDQKLVQLEFFDQVRAPRVSEIIDKQKRTAKDLAARNLRNQIKLAHLEAAAGPIPPYKLGPLG